MKKSLFILFLGALLVGCSCSDKSSSGPSDEDDYVLLTTANIGPEGGSLESEDFKLSIPAGIFEEYEELSLYLSTEDQTFGDNRASGSYRIEGIPGDCCTPLHISIKYDDTLMNESYLAVGANAFSPEVGDTVIAYGFWEADDSSGCLTCDLPLDEINTQSSASRKAVSTKGEDNLLELLIIATAVTDYKTFETAGGHFHVAYPDYFEQKAVKLGEYFEEAFLTYMALGFNYGSLQGNWPKRIAIYAQMDYYCTSRYNNTCWTPWEFSANQLRYMDYPEIRKLAGYHFFFVIPDLYGIPYALENFWLDVAVATWAEELFTGSGFTAPYAFVFREKAPLLGLKGNPMSEISHAKAHGYGMSAFIKYLVESYSSNALTQIYQAQSDNQGSLAAEVIVNTLPDNLNIWWADFFREYIDGNIYGVDEKIFIEAEMGTEVIAGPDDTLIEFSADYHSMEARLYRINLDYAAISSTAKLRLWLECYDPDQARLLVFGLKDNALEYYTVGTDVRISGIKTLAQQNWDLFIVVVDCKYSSSYTQTTSISLNGRVVDEIALDYNYGKIGLYNIESLKYDSESGGSEWQLTSYYMGEYSVGGFEDNVFTATWQSSTPPYSNSGKLTATVDPVLMVITEFTLSDTIWVYDESPYDPKNRRELITITGHDIPVYWNQSNPPERLYFKVEGTEVCEKISSFLIRNDNYITGYYWTKTGAQCDASSQLEFDFYAQNPNK